MFRTRQRNGSWTTHKVFSHAGKANITKIKVLDNRITPNRVAIEYTYHVTDSQDGTSAEEMLREMAFESRSGSTVAVDLDHDREGKWWQWREEEAAGSGTSSTYAYGNSMLEPTKKI